LAGNTGGDMDPANLSTKRQRIAELARSKPRTVLYSLHHVIDLEWMQEAYRLTRKDGATGIDGVTAADYEAKLEANLDDLLQRIKSGRCHAPPVRRTSIPKADGSQRPLGIPTFEDKVAQRAIVMVLEAVYEQDFRSCSYGFRPGRSAHDALRELYGVITRQGQYWVLDVDIRKYFDSIPHQHLRGFLDQRVTDGVISPMLSNIFLHHVLDEWFENEVRPRMAGPCSLLRFADDFVMTFKNHHDAKPVLEVLGKRLERYGLTLHPDKTRFIDFRPERQGGTHPHCQEPPFDFLGFTHTWAKSQKGKNVVRQRTAKSRLARALVAVNDWCRRNRHQPLHVQQAQLSAKLTGHYAYYGITGNIQQMGRYFRQVMRVWKKWLERRTRAEPLIPSPADHFSAR